MRASFANHWNAALLDEYYERWQNDPASVDEKWSAFFEGFALGNTTLPVSRNGTNGAGKPPAAESSGPTADSAAIERQGKVDELVRAYRTLGHTLAKLDPLGNAVPAQPLLALEALGFSEADLNEAVSSRLFMGGKSMRLGEMIERLRLIYTGKIGAEYMYIQAPQVREWVRNRIEAWPDTAPPEPAEQKSILGRLLEAEAFERFLHTRYVGQKRFSLEGGETLMALLETLLERCPKLGIQEIVMGMAHRGRLNVLANFLKKPVQMIFTEFSENYQPNLVSGDGDVKYHLGYESERSVQGGKVSVRLASNPSHLEAVNPVVQGKARARQRILEDTVKRQLVLPVLLHGDAAFAGQGVVAETLNMSQLPGYRTGGTVHIIINNQIGFTTLPADARSSRYCTDVAKMIDIPVFHVNGDDPEAVCFVAAIAVDFRQQFGRDVIIDMYCYRRYGHNEGDEPNFTQPDLYARIGKQPSVASLYRDHLVVGGRIKAEDADALLKEYEGVFENALAEVKKQNTTDGGQQAEPDARKSFAGSTAVFQPPYSHETVPTAITLETMERIAQAVSHVPDNIHVLPKLKRNLLDRRLNVFQAGGPYDWAFAEAFAFGSLLLDNKPVRLSGQDSRRGTFSQRLSVLYDVETRERYIPLNDLAREQARFCVYNSPLSEFSVLGFDYGYSLDYPEMLCLWEAQFGDFVNGAQVIIDQFIVAAESKWQRPSGIVLLLPHGYEGQGPEHSSGRMERFLQSCAEDNIQVCNLTTPAQYFHVLRRQVSRPFRKPLVIMTPKSLLRSELAVSYNKDFTDAAFAEVIETPVTGAGKVPRRVIFCTGKVYYDLVKHRDAGAIDDVAIVRIEQLYPLAVEKLRALLKPYGKVKEWVWCQEESQNMGAWTFIGPQLAEITGAKITYAGRNASASPAVGAKTLHDREQKQLVQEAFTL